MWNSNEKPFTKLDCTDSILICKWLPTQKHKQILSLRAILIEP